METKKLMTKEEFRSIVIKYAKLYYDHLYTIHSQREDLNIGERKKLTVVCSSRSKRCRGGVQNGTPIIKLAYNSPLYTRENNYYAEYDSYANDTDIGSINCKNLENKIKVVVAHEVAHAVQYGYFLHKEEFLKAHGQGFKYLYRILRRDFVNPDIEKLEFETFMTLDTSPEKIIMDL